MQGPSKAPLKPLDFWDVVTGLSALAFRDCVCELVSESITGDDCSALGDEIAMSVLLLVMSRSILSPDANFSLVFSSAMSLWFI
jgi:hypothetical protein